MFMAKSIFPLLIYALSEYTPMRIYLVLWLFLIPFCLINLSTNIFVVTGQCLGHQQSLLLHMKNNLIFNSAKSKILVHWNQSDDCCQWPAVTCSKGRVIALDLSQEHISGGLDDSSALFSLQYLQSLNLAFNDFSYVIPRKLYKLKNLRYLNLSNAGFEGHIPNEISHLRRLVILDLSLPFTSRHNLKFEKPNIAMLVQNLTEITELYLDGVAISAKGKEWCHTLSSLKDLRVLSMSSCNLSGPIDSSLAKLHSLNVLKLNQNNLTSLVPQSFANFSNLTTLELRGCGLSDVFPKGIFQILTLKVLDISDNQDLRGSLPNFPLDGSLHMLNLSNTNFSGQLPSAISNLKQLSTLDLSNCQFNGTLPSSMSELTQLVHLDLSSNNFTGPLPPFNMSKHLTYLSLFHNDLKGELPSDHFNSLVNLVSIDLGYNFFSGSVPSSLLELPNLRELKLPYNHLDGLLGEFMYASSSMLEMVDLGSNNLQGPIPVSVFDLRRLRVLQLSSNKFNGTVKLDMIRRQTNLSTLDLSHNILSIDANTRNDHVLPPFPNLSNLMLASCKLRGIPSFLRNQSTLLYLDLSSNEIQGAMPNWIWRIESMVYLNISINFLTNSEGNFRNLSSNLFVLDIHSNNLQGPIPFIPKYACYLDYSSNRFSTIIPPDIGNHLPFTIFLSLSNNSFHGQIDESFCNAHTLRVLDLSYNNFDGMIPECLVKMSKTLRVLNLGGNKLRGNISDTMSTSCSLRFLDLNDNLMGGGIPKSLVNCQNLQVLNLGNNLLVDRFPCFLNSISTLRILFLRSNKFHGQIGCPNSTGNWEMLHIVDLASNNFTGTIPRALLKSWTAMTVDEDKVKPEFGHLFQDIFDNYNPLDFDELLSVLNKYVAVKLAKLIANEPRSIIDQLSADVSVQDLDRYQDSVTVVNKGLQMKMVKIQSVFTYVDLSLNNFEGPIPDELMSLKALDVLNLSHNAFLGLIPSSLGNLKHLESLDLSYNSLSGEIPKELASLTFLEFLNVSFNHLVGEIPIGSQLQTFEASSFKGNEGLCGPPLTKNCSDDGVHELSPPPPASETHTSVDWNFLSAELGFTFGFGFVILPLIFWRRWRLWYCKRVDDLLSRVIPQLDFVYEQHGGKKYRTLRWRPY